MNTQGKAQIQAVIESGNWPAIIEVKNWMIKEWQGLDINKDTDFLTLKTALEKENKITALREFFDMLEVLAYDSSKTIPDAE